MPATFSVPARPPALLAAAAQQRLQSHIVAENQRANALRAAEFVRRQAQRVDVERRHIDGDAARRLDGVAMDARAITAGETRRRFDRLHRAGFGVFASMSATRAGAGARSRGAFERREVDPPVAARRNPHRAKGGGENGIVLDGRDDRRRMGDSRARRDCWLRSPPPVKTTRSGGALTSRATFSRASSTVARAARPAP